MNHLLDVALRILEEYVFIPTGRIYSCKGSIIEDLLFDEEVKKLFVLLRSTYLVVAGGLECIL